MTDKITEARRAKFEAWEDAGDITRSGDFYENPYVECAWQGFNAALDSVVVELPSCDPSEAVQHGDVINDCRNAIHAAGVRTK